MNSYELEKRIRKWDNKGIFHGVYPSDELPFFNQKPFCIIGNTSSHEYSNGHWVSFFVINDVIEFFDSYGRSPLNYMFPIYFKEYISNMKCVYNTRILEGIFDNTCGDFCAYFAILRIKGYSYVDILNSLSTDVLYNRDVVTKLF